MTEYVWDEVLARQKPATRAFLTRTSVVAEVSGDLADAICGQTGGAAVLARLNQENCLVEALDGAAHGYRYHPLLREVLSAELHRQSPHEVPVLLGRAARWYAAHDRALEAVRAAAAAWDWDLATDVLAGSAIGIVMADGPRALESVLGLFPADRGGEAAVAAAWASARLWSEDAEGAAVYLDSAARSVRRAARTTRRVIEPVLAALRILGTAELRCGDPELTRRGWALAGPALQTAATRAEHRAAGLLWFALGCASLHRWDMAAAARALQHADRQLSTAGLDPLRARARAWHALALACGGELTAAQRAADEIRTHAIPVTAEAACLAALGGAQVSLARDDLVAAQRLLDEADGDRAGHVPGEPSVTAIRTLIQARVLLADGDPAAARAALARLHEGPLPGSAGLAAAAAVVEVETALRAGDPGHARALLRAHGEPGTGRGDLALARAGLLMAEGDFRGARAAVAPCLDGAAARTRHERTRALLAAAVAARRLGEAARAAAQISEALGLAEPEGDYRVFLDGGLAVRSAVTVLVPPTSRYAGFVEPGPGAVRQLPAAPRRCRRRPGCHRPDGCAADRPRARGAPVPAVAHDQRGDLRGTLPVRQHGEDAPAVGLPETGRPVPAGRDRPRASARPVVRGVSPGERPPGTPRWPAARFLRHRAGALLARGSDPGTPRWPASPGERLT